MGRLGYLLCYGLVQFVRLSQFKSFVHLISGGSRIFPRGGGVNPPGGREHAKFSRKLHEIERIWTPRGGACVPHAPPRSANANIFYNTDEHLSNYDIFRLK